MNTTFRFPSGALLLALLLARPLVAIDSTAVKKLFADPPREYSTGPLWVWNDRLTEQQIRSTLRDLAGQRVKQVWVHPRPGLMTPYLADEWFQLWKVSLDEAEKLDMNVWIYDENSYPSGFAGGWVPELMPESRGLGLELREVKTAPKWTDAILRVLRAKDEKYEAVDDVTAAVKAGEALPEGRYFVSSINHAGDSPWHGNRCYVNLLTPGVTEKFLEVTLEPYKRQVGAQFGKRIPGVFTDEPNIRPAGGLPWCDDLPAQFEKRWGYNLLDRLPSLTKEVGDWRRVRHNYYSLLNELFIERWAKPYYDWCEKNGLEATGHYWDHEWPHCVGVPDNMAMAAWQHRPGVDTLMNQYAENTHAQFGNVRYCREVSSIANQLGRSRTLVELYGAGGWDLRFEDMKRIGDWLQVLGINTLNEHLSYVTLRGARKRDHPQSFSYHEPWWEAYHVVAGYLTRLSAALSQGEQINRILVIEPTSTAWMYQGNEAKLKALGDSFMKLLLALEEAQIEYDLGDEDVIARFGKPSEEATAAGQEADPGTRPRKVAERGRALQIGRRQYELILYPFGMENISSNALRVLDQVSARKVLASPTYVDGGAVTNMPATTLTIDGLPALIDEVLQPVNRADGFAVERIAGDKGILFHHRRHLADGQILLLVNTSIEHRSFGLVRSPFRGLEQWNLHTGAPQPYPYLPADKGCTARFDLPPSGSLLLFLTDRPLRRDDGPAEAFTALSPTGPTDVQRLDPNVLTLDYVDITVAGESRTNVYFYQANQLAWKQHGMDRNPWDSAVQFKDELIARTFPADSGFKLQYRFTIEGAVPPNLSITVERPDLYAIACNGQPVKPKPGAWWLDKAFGVIELASVARVGENVVALEAKPFTMYHEIEPVYVRGDFALKPVAQGFVIVPDQPLQVGGAAKGWNQQGHPFYSAGVAYRQTFKVERKAARAVVRLPNWYGSVARVRINGDLAGYISAPPWELEVGPDLVVGANEIEVAVIGTLKNTLGPHHNNPPLGSAWPGMFQQGAKDGQPPGGSYSTVSYGLFEPFVLARAQKP